MNPGIFQYGQKNQIKIYLKIYFTAGIKSVLFPVSAVCLAVGSWNKKPRWCVLIDALQQLYPLYFVQHPSCAAEGSASCGAESLYILPCPAQSKFTIVPQKHPENRAFFLFCRRAGHSATHESWHFLSMILKEDMKTMQNSNANDTSQSKSRQSISSHPVSGEAGEFHSSQAAPASSALSLEDAEEILRRVYQSAGIAPPENCSEILCRGSKHTRT